MEIRPERNQLEQGSELIWRGFEEEIEGTIRWSLELLCENLKFLKLKIGSIGLELII